MNALNNNALRYIAAWAVHLFTASGVCLGIFTLQMIYEHRCIAALWLMAITVFIDAVDGTFARIVDVKTYAGKIDGALLDNIVDFLNYVIAPCFFLLVKPEMLPENFSIVLISAISVTSAYQFCQNDAKTPDHFFKGFPCYWNIAVLYMFIFDTSPAFNALILSLFSILIFVPIKYIYPSRIDYLTKSKALKIMMHCCSMVYGVCTLIVLFSYPNTNKMCLAISLGYIALYLFLSFYRTCSPLVNERIQTHKE